MNWALFIMMVLLFVIRSIKGEISDPNQALLEQELIYVFEQQDNFPEGEDVHVNISLREKDALPAFKQFINRSGWSTNRLVEGLICVVTNNLCDANWHDTTKRMIAGKAMSVLNEINHPLVTNFFHSVNEEGIRSFSGNAVLGMFTYTNLEPDVLAYMQTLCLRTNTYDNVAGLVMNNMFEVLESLPNPMKLSGTNRVARYMYFALHHVTDTQGWQDRRLCCLVPSYSNSLQRLKVMQYISSTATNTWERSHATDIMNLLSATPTNQLNNISWIEETF